MVAAENKDNSQQRSQQGAHEGNSFITSPFFMQWLVSSKAAVVGERFHSSSGDAKSLAC